MARIEFKDFSIQFWGQNEPILEGINLEFTTDEKILLLSPSGSGKSSLLMCLLGIIERNNLGETKGEILIDGRGILDYSPMELAKIFGIVFQEPESQFCLLYPDEEVAFSLENLSIPKKDIKKRVEEALKTVGIYEKRDQNLGTMSGGEQQKVAIASSIALSSSMLLLDEPTANLDSLARQEIRNQILALDKGFLLVEHNLDDWIDCVERVVVLERNKGIVLDSTRDEFISSANEVINNLGIWEPGNKWLDIEKKTFILGEEVVRVENLCYSVKNKKILKGIDISIREGEVIGVLGKNGSGKSTLSKVVARILKADLGGIYYRNEEIGEVEDFYSKIAYVFQNPEHQFIRDSVEAEIGLSLDTFRSKASVEEILDRYNLKDLRKENPFTLSGGEKRRLSVAIMLSENHRFLILDEPTFGLDYTNAKELMESVAKLSKSGVAVLIISHDMELVEKYTSSVVVLEDGKKVYDGMPSLLWKEEELLRRNGLVKPSNVEVERGVISDVI